MKQKNRLPHLFLGIVTVILYLPIILVVVYSFNESKISSVWSGFSLTWYETLFRDKDMFQALINSIVLGLCSSVCAALIGTLGAVGPSRACRPEAKSRLNTFPHCPS